MLSNIGQSLIVLTLLTSFMLLFSSVNFLKFDQINIKKLYSLNFSQSIFAILSFLVLIIGFLTSDFSLINVYENSHSQKPLVYKISGAWGNHEGSLLLWINILILFSFLFFHHNKKLNKNYILFTIIIQNILIIGFLIFLFLNSNPFSVIHPVPKEGLGLNPILQDPALAIHPPLLYVGFVGSSIFFSAGIASLITNFRGKIFAQSIKKWIYTTWSFLTLGILAGSVWAYYELGWGGFWFWDPVENASLMPWFVLTALLHSIIVLAKRETIYTWVIILCVLSFTLSVMGTFLVRSGILNSVHTFASDPSRGLYILIFLSLMIFSSVLIFFKKYPKESYNFELHSKETFILVNNWFMFFFLVTVLIGTLYPIFLEVITNIKISVGAPFFNIVIIPLIIPFLFFMSLGPRVKWIKENAQIIKKSLKVLLYAVIINLIIYYFFGQYSLLSNLILIAAIFLILHNIVDIFISIKDKKILNFSRISSHLGFGLLIFFISINHSYTIEKDFNLRVGEEKNFNKFNISFDKLNVQDRKNYKAIVGEFTLTKSNDKEIKILKPEIRIYTNPETLTYEASIKTAPGSDHYLTMSNISRSDFYNIKFQYKPFMIWIWISVILISFGGILRIFERKYEN